MSDKVGVGNTGFQDTAYALEKAASFGRWWYNHALGQIEISPMAASYLDINTEHEPSLDACFINVVEDDLVGLIAMITAGREAEEAQPEFEFRVITANEGLRWMRASLLGMEGQNTEFTSGVLTDITRSKDAAIRERLGFELTELLVGSGQLNEVIVNVIQLVCKSLGWEWGAYWSMEDSPHNGVQLGCRHLWSGLGHQLGAFSGASTDLVMKPGEGLVGQVWASGCAQWIDISTNLQFLRRNDARSSGLLSGYIFPVTYVSQDGAHHRPGVLEFYSCRSRQQEAQLPKLSATIGALIAQTTQRMEREVVIHRLARIDELTELSNRSHFHACLTERCVSAAKLQEKFGLMYIDLDRFKPINDAYGHDAGNYVLREFAARLKSIVPADTAVGRLGGDEFALVTHCSSDESLSELASQVLEVARAPFQYDGVELTVSASIGISRFPENGQTPPELLRSADAAMYRIKQNGRNSCDIFSNSSPISIAKMQASLAQRLSIETELHHAIDNKELFLVYQPIFDVSSGLMHGIEALIRWRRANGDLVPPDVFIPIAEQSHLIVEIGRWVMAQACADLSTLYQAGFHGLKVHVNMAASEFTNEDLPTVLCELARAHRIHPSSVNLELTEGMLMKQPELVVSVMRKLRSLGFEISLDDFGMGHSSLSMLKNLPITSMKIDRSFIRDIAHSQSDQAIAKAILTLGNNLKMDVIAEGIETEAQLSKLKEEGCHLIQ
jgi:diguanylate cyclase (GGDEF)-like protein